MPYEAERKALRERLGNVGVWLAVLARTPFAEARAGAATIDELGYGSLWINEGFGTKEPMSHAALLLDATDRLVLGTGIANIWARDAAAANAAAATLGEAHPGRFVLGLGVSHQPMVDRRGHTYGRPLAAMRAYLDALDDAPWAGPPPAEPAPRVLAALRPRMVELAAQRAAGVHSYFVPVAHTERVREALGPDPLLIPELAVVLEGDPGRARERAREHASVYLGLPNYTNNLRDLGYAAADIAHGASDRLIDDVIAWGDDDAIAARVQAHLDAGADHVLIQPLGTFEQALDQLRALGPALLSR